MQKWVAGVCLCLAVTLAAQEDEAGKANRLIHEGKRLEALPLFEDLYKSHPDEWGYAEGLANCLEAKAIQSNDPAEVKALRTREREVAARAVQLGDPNEYVKLMANIDPDKPIELAPSSPASALLQEAERAFTAGDFDAALAKYGQAADADPRLYEAPLYAGDTALRKKDLKTAAKWFARAVEVDPNRETAYRYWGDTLVQLGNDPIAARPKFVDAVIAEPYNKLAWQGLRQWAQANKVVMMAPKIDRPSGPVEDPKKPNNITINIDPTATDDKKHPGSSAWLMYSIIRAGYRGDNFKKNFPEEKQYRHTLKEEDAALSLVAESVKEKKIKPEKLDESLRNLVELNDAGMLDSWILINGADQGIAQDYDAYRKEHRDLLRNYINRFVIHGGVLSTQ